jgi:hypothetical protein
MAMRSCRDAPGRAATPQHDADLLVALLQGDVTRLEGVLKERGHAELLWWSQPLPLYHAAVLDGNARAVTVLAAAGAPIELAEVDGIYMRGDILGLLEKQLGAENTAVLDGAARGEQSAAVLAASLPLQRQPPLLLSCCWTTEPAKTTA